MIKYFESIIFIRITVLVPLLNEIAVMRVIVETLKNLLGPLSNLFCLILSIFYDFAILGMLFFGGRIQTNTQEINQDPGIPQLYILCNFNDLLMSFVTLFALVVVNNWQIIVQMCVAVRGGETDYRLYFIIFYYLCVILGVNMFVAFAIDMYCAVTRLDQQKCKNE